MASLSSAGLWSTLIVRILIAVAAGAVIGIDREWRGKAAGLRTHILVSVGACLFVMIPDLMGGSPDAASRVVQGIAAGIGFLGAGEILRFPSKDPAKARISGLTSAAASWVAAGLGAAAGCGLWRLSVVGSVVTFLSLTLVEKVERPLSKRRDATAHRDADTDSSRRE